MTGVFEGFATIAALIGLGILLAVTKTRRRDASPTEY